MFTFSFYRWLLPIVFLFAPFTFIFAENATNANATAVSPLSDNSHPTARIPVLVYHNFNPTTPGSMNLTPERFKEQMQWIKDNHFTVIPLSQLVSFLQGKTHDLPVKPVVITADDGWESQYTYMVPIIREYHYPVTLFIYPSLISKGKHSMTWDQLQALQRTGEFDIQGHTLTHPNFKKEKKRLSPGEYQTLVDKELVASKKILEEKMNKPITLLAWPFGIYNEDLEQQAAKAGYVMAFTIDARPTSQSFNPMMQPRYMIVAPQTMTMFAAILNTSHE